MKVEGWWSPAVVSVLYTALVVVVVCAALAWSVASGRRAPLQPSVGVAGSRYVSWLPSFSVEVTRVRGEGEGADAAQRLQHMFPQYSVATLAADLARTASADLTLDNILAGRLAAEPELLDAATSTVEPWTPPPSAYLLAGPSTAADTLERADAALNDEDYEAAGGAFRDSAAEREATLARRKEALVSSARLRYLRRSAPATPAPASPHS